MSARGGPRKGAGRKPGAINKATASARKMAEETGETPLEFMLRVMRDPEAEDSDRMDMAKAAAPYVHARLSSVDVDANHRGEVTHKIILEGVAASGNG